MDTPAAPMTIVEALQLIRGGEPTQLTDEQATRLMVVLENNPSLHVLVGDEVLVQKFREALSARCGIDSSDESAGETAPAQRGGRRIFLTAAALLAIAVAAWWLMREIKPEQPGDRSGARSPGTAAKPLDSPPADAKPQDSNGPVAAPLSEPTITATAAPTAGKPEKVEAAEVHSKPVAAPAKEADEDEPLLDVVNGEARLDPDGKDGWKLSNLNGSTNVELSGKVQRLEIGDINGRVVLDGSALEATEIDIRGTINGSGTVKLNASGGTVRFHGSIGGDTTVEVAAEGGSVLFLHGDGSSAPVIGGTKMKITAKEVKFAAAMDGGSRTDVTLTRDGSLHYAVVTGGAKLHYRKAAPEDPAIVLHEGKLSGGGKVTSE